MVAPLRDPPTTHIRTLGKDDLPAHLLVLYKLFHIYYIDSYPSFQKVDGAGTQ